MFKFLCGCGAEVPSGNMSESQELEKTYHSAISPEVTPINYKLTLQPNLSPPFDFSGGVEIEIEVHRSLKAIKVHSVDLDIRRAWIEYINQEVSVSARKIEYKADDQIAVLTFDETIDPVLCILHVEFKGVLNDDLVGFYRSKYTGADGSAKYMAVTQFEATDARRCFPCFDEPNLKATFEVTIISPASLKCVSNMPALEGRSSVLPDGSLMTRFKATPIMSTYLLAFVVGDFDFIESSTRRGIKVRVYTPVGKTHLGEFALKVCTKALTYFEEIFNIKYPLPKLDLFAIPDFAAGAMENWGCITYRETMLLIDPKTSTAARKQRVARVVGHELAHQWFGNLVTMDWWSDLWLNEGFARWAEFLAVNHCFPDFEIWPQFSGDILGSALRLDALESSHPVEVDVQRSEEIDEIFDIISYAKGASVIRMLSSYIGVPVFLDGLTAYLRRHEYGNAKTVDLWAALEEVSGKDIKGMMKIWTRNTGYPLLSVELLGHKTLKLSQKRFLSTGKTAHDDTVWHIPVSIITSGNKKAQYLVLDKKEDTFELEHPIAYEAGEWIKVNAGQVGMYRVKYPKGSLSSLAAAISAKAINAVDRLGPLSDSFALAKAGMIPTHDVLQLLTSYKLEDDFTVWSEVSACIDRFKGLLGGESYYSAFEGFARALFLPIGRTVGWEDVQGESHTRRMLRSLVICQLCELDVPGYISVAQDKFERFIKSKPKDKDKHDIPADVRSAVYSAVIRHGGIAAYNKVYALYKKCDFAEEKLRLLSALGASNRPELLQRTLDMTLTDEIRTQDVCTPVIAVAANPIGRKLPWEFFKSNYDKFSAKLGKTALLANFIAASVSHFSSQEDAAEVMAFFNKHPCPSADKKIKQSIEGIKASAEWLQRDGADVRSWLQRNMS